MTKGEQKFDAAMYRKKHSGGIARAYIHAAEVMGASDFPELKQAAKEVARMARDSLRDHNCEVKMIRDEVEGING